MVRLLYILLGLAIWWLILPLERYLVADGERLMSVGIPLFILSAFLLYACFANRKNELVVLLWGPLFVLSGWLLKTITFALIGEMQAPGGGEPAPLEGTMMLLSMAIGVATLAIFIGCLACLPRKINWGLLIVSIANIALIFFIIWFTAEKEARQIITVRILDKFDKPVEGAAVTYKVYGYGPRGTRPASPEIAGGPILTNDQGVAHIRSKKIRYEVLLDVSKSGYLPISAELGMQFYDYDSKRDLKLNLSNLTDIAHGDVSAADPVVVSLYLPSLDDKPQPLRHKELHFGISGEESSYRCLDFHSGYLVPNPKGDLRFDFVHEPSLYHAGSDDQRLELTALQGSGIVQAPFGLTSDSSISVYDQMMLIAPLSGYSDHIIVSGDSYIYYRNSDGTLYARLKVFGAPAKNGAGGIMLEFWTNPTGSRNLLFDPSLQIK